MAFLDRFSSGAAPDRGGGELKSIIENLNNILNTRREYGSFLKDFGIRDMNEYSSRDNLTVAVMEEVRLNIERYEPRLVVEDISAENTDDPFRISFKIACTLKDSRESLLMEFNSVSKKLKINDS